MSTGDVATISDGVLIGVEVGEKADSRCIQIGIVGAGNHYMKQKTNLSYEMC